LATSTTERSFDTVEEFWTDGDLALASEAASARGLDTLDEFEHRFVELLAASGDALVFASAREALRVALGLLKPRRGCDAVVVPSFCCHVVAEAVLAAGMRLLLVDSDPVTGSLNWSSVGRAMRMAETRALVVPHLFGLPVEFREVAAAAARSGIVVIEDCAHCLGARVQGRIAGTLGQMAVFSFNFDKPISLGGGGLLVCNPSAEIAQPLWQSLRATSRTNAPPVDRELQQLLAFRATVLARRRAIRRVGWSWKWRVRRRVRSTLNAAERLGIRRQTAGETFEALGPVKASLGVAMLKGYSRVQRARNANHETLRQALSLWHSGQLPAAASPDIEPSWLRGKVVLPELGATGVDLLGRRLCAAGFRSGRLNWGVPIHEHPAMAHCGSRMHALDSLAQASALARRGLDVPIHQEMSTEDVEYLASLIRDGVACLR